jgi:YD repeat-containing protein
MLRRTPPRNQFAVGSLLTLTSCVGSIFLTSAATAAESVTYSYDARGRLVEVVRTDSANNTVRTTYSYDRANNRTSVTTTGSSNTSPPTPSP